MKSIAAIFLLANSLQAQPLHLAWDSPTNYVPTGYLVAMGTQTPNNFSTNWLVFTNNIGIDAALLIGPTNYFACQAFQISSNGGFITGFSQWLAVQNNASNFAALTITGTTNLSSSWTTVTNFTVPVNMISTPNYFFKMNIAIVHSNSFNVLTN